MNDDVTIQSNRLASLAGVNIACHFFYHVFHRTPDEAFLNQIYSEGLLKQWPVALDDSMEKSLRSIEKELSDLHSDRVSTLSRDYADLFVGPGALKAAPWGSVYLSEDQTTCGESTQAVKAFYRSVWC